MRNFSQNKITNRNTFSKPSYRIVYSKKNSANLNSHENNCQNIKTPIHNNKKSYENENKSLTVKMLKNKENLNINYLNNRNFINNYSSSRKSSHLICSKIANKCNFIEPKNLFHNDALKNIGSNTKRKLF